MKTVFFFFPLTKIHIVQTICDLLRKCRRKHFFKKLVVSPSVYIDCVKNYWRKTKNCWGRKKKVYICRANTFYPKYKDMRQWRPRTILWYPFLCFAIQSSFSNIFPGFLAFRRTSHSNVKCYWNVWRYKFIIMFSYVYAFFSERKTRSDVENRNMHKKIAILIC